MSWVQKLYETYDQSKGRESPGTSTLLPVSHSIQQAHVEITLDEHGNFISARTIGKEETTIPATEQSAGRTGRTPPPHPLCDKVQYCAADYPEMGGSKPSFFKEYEAQLAEWCNSAHSHAKAQSVLTYIRKRRVVADLVREDVLHLGADGKLLTRWASETQAPELFRVLTAKSGERDQGDAFIRWHVREPGNPCTAVWEDVSLQDDWAEFDASTKEAVGVCMVTGEMQASLALSHPKRIRHSGDGAKLISANDSSGYTFRGRFTDDTGQQACGVSYEVTQKAHNALRWLIQRQAYRNGDQVVVSWAVAGKPIPDPFGNSLTLMLAGIAVQQQSATPELSLGDDAGQAFAKRLNLALAGYRANIGPPDDIVVMGLDSATPGRMAITYYRELTGSEFLGRIEAWHKAHAWPQNFGRELKFVGAPAPRDIAEAAFGRRLDDKLKKSTVERLLPCIIDGQPLPRDLVESTVRRASNRVGLDHWEWEKTLGIACALFKGAFKNKEYEMSLETDRHSRDYLYGRLLAIAEHIENRALYVAGEKRDTTAAKLMQRFADRPASTWRIIEPALKPYISRLRTKRSGFMHEMDKLLDEIIPSFVGDDFLDDSKLSGEFLLGYHCQRQVLNPPKIDNTTVTEDAPTE
ncbi:MAG TPA: type I-C CRISPR-associated protein Cas8c/Csd1 [Halothiobacillus sp.]|nr:type I-C CRISPR-associated protein Cas8c/Csd1 [Halothiobacillus sp.]